MDKKKIKTELLESLIKMMRAKETDGWKSMFDSKEEPAEEESEMLIVEIEGKPVKNKKKDIEIED